IKRLAPQVGSRRLGSGPLVRKRFQSFGQFVLDSEADIGADAGTGVVAPCGRLVDYQLIVLPLLVVEADQPEPADTILEILQGPSGMVQDFVVDPQRLADLVLLFEAL